MHPSVQSLYERIGGREKLAILLKHFYADVRQHHLLGPVFNRHIHDWPAHLSHIGEFWSRLAGGPSHFEGSLPLKHARLGIGAHHFDAWLELWKFNCVRQLPPQEANEMIDLAQMIGKRLQHLLAAAPGAG